jgi:large subunit ribosomal protein L28
MAAKCVLTGKKTTTGNNVSHSKVKTKRRLYPNLQKKRIFIPELDKTVTMMISTRALRSLKKNGALNFIRQMQAQGSQISL